MKQDDILGFQRVTRLEDAWSQLVFRAAPQLLPAHDHDLRKAFHAAATAVVELRAELLAGSFELDSGARLQWSPDELLELLPR